MIGKFEASYASKLIKVFEWELEKIKSWNREEICNLFQNLAEKEDKKLKEVLPLFFQVITGEHVSLPLFDSIEILGQDLVRIRLRKALDFLTAEGFGISKKGLKSLEKDYRLKYGDRID